jgi:glycosyltransferase involved in cell wall biosynthesis
MMTNETPPIKLALVSCGLGRVRRGFEISTARWQAALSSDPRLELRVFSGGTFPDAERVWNISRNGLLDSPLGVFRALNERRFWELCYRLEQLSFSIGFIPKILSWQPDIIWTKELPVGRLLMLARAVFRLKFKLIVANGNGVEPQNYKDFDLIQQLLPDSFDDAVRFGIRRSKMQLLPNCVSYAAPTEPRNILRKKFGFENDDWVIVCVAAWNRYQKRIDYLINEVAALKDPTAKLLLCGHPEAETEALKVLATQRLGASVRWLTLTSDDVYRALYISNVFVLPSFQEGLSSALIEAVMAGLPVVCHPHPCGKYVLEDDGWLVDLSQAGALTNRLGVLRDQSFPKEKMTRLQNRAIERFGAGTLADEFYKMVERVHTTEIRDQ